MCQIRRRGFTWGTAILERGWRTLSGMIPMRQSVRGMCRRGFNDEIPRRAVRCCCCWFLWLRRFNLVNLGISGNSFNGELLCWLRIGFWLWWRFLWWRRPLWRWLGNSLRRRRPYVRRSCFVLRLGLFGFVFRLGLLRRVLRRSFELRSLFWWNLLLLTCWNFIYLIRSRETELV